MPDDNETNSRHDASPGRRTSRPVIIGLVVIVVALLAYYTFVIVNADDSTGVTTTIEGSGG